MVYVAALHQALKHGLMLNKRYLVMKFEQKVVSDLCLETKGSRFESS